MTRFVTRLFVARILGPRRRARRPTLNLEPPKSRAVTSGGIAVAQDVDAIAGWSNQTWHTIRLIEKKNLLAESQMHRLL